MGLTCCCCRDVDNHENQGTDWGASGGRRLGGGSTTSGGSAATAAMRRARQNAKNNPRSAKSGRNQTKARPLGNTVDVDVNTKAYGAVSQSKDSEARAKAALGRVATAHGGDLEKAKQLSQARQIDELKGKIYAAYNAKGEEPPLIPKSSTVASLKKMLKVAQKKR
eukprot:g5285.t1